MSPDAVKTPSASDVKATKQHSSFASRGEVLTKPHLLDFHQAMRHSVSELSDGDSGKNIITIIFRSGWRGKSPPVVHRVLKIHNSQRTLTRFEEYRDVVRSRAAKRKGGGVDERCIADGNERLRFYYSTTLCSLGGGLDASKFVTTKKKAAKTPELIGLELLATSQSPAPASTGAVGAGTPLENLLVSKTPEMTDLEMYISEEINAEFRESLLACVRLQGTIFLKTLPPKKAAEKETEFSFCLEGTSSIKRVVLQSSCVSSLENGLFHVRTPSKEELIPIMKYSLQPRKNLSQS